MAADFNSWQVAIIKRVVEIPAVHVILLVHITVAFFIVTCRYHRYLSISLLPVDITVTCQYHRYLCRLSLLPVCFIVTCRYHRYLSISPLLMVFTVIFCRIEMDLVCIKTSFQNTAAPAGMEFFSKRNLSQLEMKRSDKILVSIKTHLIQ